MGLWDQLQYSQTPLDRDEGPFNFIGMGMVKKNSTRSIPPSLVKDETLRYLHRECKNLSWYPKLLMLWNGYQQNYAHWARRVQWRNSSKSGIFDTPRTQAIFHTVVIDLEAQLIYPFHSHHLKARTYISNIYFKLMTTFLSHNYINWFRIRSRAPWAPRCPSIF